MSLVFVGYQHFHVKKWITTQGRENQILYNFILNDYS